MTTQNSFLGEWRIVEMEQWDRDYIDMVVPGHFTFERGGHGSFQFGTVDGGLDCRLVSSKEGPRVEFTWEGFSEMDPVSGRGWAMLRNREIVGHLYFHGGDDSSFRAVPKKKRALTARPTRTRQKRSAIGQDRARRAVHQDVREQESPPPVTNDEAAQIAVLLNTRNQLTVPYDAARVLKSADQYLFRAVEGRVVAAVELKNVQWYQGEVCHLTVHEEFEGKGYARNLFAELERRAAARGFRVLQCTIREGNTDSEGFFTKAGFKPVSRFHNKMNGNNVAIWHKVLEPAL